MSAVKSVTKPNLTPLILNSSNTSITPSCMEEIKAYSISLIETKKLILVD